MKATMIPVVDGELGKKIKGNWKSKEESRPSKPPHY